MSQPLGQRPHSLKAMALSEPQGLSLTPSAGEDLHKVVREPALLQLQDHVLDVPKAACSREAEQNLPIPLKGNFLEVFVPAK